MNIEIKKINEILLLYNIEGQVSNVFDFIHYYNEKEKEIKIISKVEFTNREPLVIKFLRENDHPSHVIEAQSVFSEYIRKQGVLTPRRYISGEKYCINYKLNRMDVDITIEDYLGKEVMAIDFRMVNIIGQLLGKIHKISENGNCLIGRETIFNLLGHNEVNGYNTFCELGKNGKIDAIMYHKIKNLYEKKLSNIKQLWNELPRFATQGDISINNLSDTGKELGIFDYNIAGDEVLVSDMVLEGLLTANEMDLVPELTDKDRVELFRQFYKGYITEKPLSNVEKKVLNDIYSLSSALWFTKIKYNDSSLEKLVEKNEHDRVQILLQQIYDSLQEDNSEIFKIKK